MKHAYKLLPFLIFFFGVFIFDSELKGQNNEAPSFHEKMESAKTYWDNQLLFNAETELLESGSDYKHFLRYYDYYNKRIVSGNNVEDYFLKLENFYNFPLSPYNVDYYWNEIGPFTGPNTGPINFLSQSPNNPNLILAGAEFGGLFYSNNGMNECSWQNASTDHLSPSISAADAQISHLSDDVWFYMDGNGEPEFTKHYSPILSRIRPATSVKEAKTYGIYRTTDAGQTWEQIGDRNKLYNDVIAPGENSKWTMKKMVIDPNSGSDDLTIYISSSIGIFRTKNAMASDVIWEKVYSIEDTPVDLIDGVDGNIFSDKQLWIYKIIWMPNENSDDGLFIATAMKTMRNPDINDSDLIVNEGIYYDSSILYSETGDANSWQEWNVPIPNPYPFQTCIPNIDPDEDCIPITYINTAKALKIDLAISPDNQNMLYVYCQSIFDEFQEDEVRTNHFSVLRADISSIPNEINATDWEEIATGDHPSSYTVFNVSPIDEHEIFYSQGIKLNKITFNGTNWINSLFGNCGHDDQEDLIFDSNGNMFCATHGGVTKILAGESSGSKQWKNEGLGVAQIQSFATSYSNPETIAVALWHDGTKATTNPTYSENWIPQWFNNMLWGDAFDPDINYSNNNYIYTRNQYASYTRVYTNFPSSTTSDYKPLTSGHSNSFSDAGISLNYFNHNTVYLNWKRDDDSETSVNEKLNCIFRHPNKGGVANDPHWQMIFKLRDGDGTHPILSELILNNLEEIDGDQKIEIRGIFSSKADENLLFTDIHIAGESNTSHIGITNKAQLGIIANQNENSDIIMDEINDSWVILKNPENPNASFGWINSIESDPMDPNVFYIVANNHRQLTKVTYLGNIMETEINPELFQFDPVVFASYDYVSDDSDNQSNIYVGSIQILPGTGDIFVGTDMGVYNTTKDKLDLNISFPDNNPIEDTWTRYGSYIPNVDVHEIEPNFVADKLRAGTFGRGAWEIPLPCDKLDYAYVINTGEDAIINNYARFRQDVVVEDGATLTLTPQAKVYFAEHCALIVKPGGELIVDGALLSNACGDVLWLGISVEGNADLPQVPSSNQGKVTVKNGATIENAHTGVWLRANTEECTEILNSGGGLVFASNSTFKNCYVGIEFSPYRDFFSNNNPKANRSRIRECHFLTTRTLNAGFEAKAGISLKEINKLYIRGNTFENAKVVGQNHPDYTGIGILSANSTFKAYDYCSVLLPYGTPCPEGDIVRNTFINLVHGVRAYAWDEINTFTVDNALFDKCAYGLFAKKVHYAKITNCDFDVSPDPTTVGSLQWTPYGTHLLGCGSYEVEENKFYSDDNTYERVGIVIEHSYDISNEIYKNEFNNLFVGSLAQGDNQVYTNEDEGLEMLCGKYGEDDSNFYDIAFTDESNVAQLQGSNSSGGQYSPYNLMFVNTCSDDNNFHVDDDSQWFVYYYQGTDEYDFPNLTDCYNENLLIDVEIDFNKPYEEACPSSFSSSGDVIVKKETVENKRIEIADVKSELSTVANGGEDEQLLVNTIKNTSNSSLVIRNLLYPLSPNLTDSVLIEIIKRSPAMNEWHLTELLIGNSPLRLSVLEEYYIQNPLPDFLHALLMNYQAGETNLAALKKELKSKETTKNRAEGDYIRRMIMDLEETVDYMKIEELLAQEEDNQSLKVKIALASAKGDYAAAQSYLDLYQPVSNEDAYIAYQSTLLEIQGQPNSFCELSGAQKSNLEAIVNNNKKERYAAENILEYADDQEFDEFIVLPTAGDKSMRVAKDRELSEIPLMNAYPNPAVDEVYFAFSNQEDLEQAILTIYNSEGRSMQVFDMSKYKGIVRVSIKDWASGIYFCNLSIDGLKISASKFTKL